jgi:hypothetical protein
MSKSITVPDIGYNPIRLQINNKTYDLIPGATMTVPDEVAALLSQIAGAKPKEDPDIADKLNATRGEVKAMIAAAMDAPDAPKSPIEVVGTFDWDDDNGVETVIITASLQDLFDQYLSGRSVYLSEYYEGTKMRHFILDGVGLRTNATDDDPVLSYALTFTNMDPGSIGSRPMICEFDGSQTGVVKPMVAADWRFQVTASNDSGEVVATTTTPFATVRKAVQYGMTVIAEVTVGGMIYEARLVARDAKSMSDSLVFGFLADFGEPGVPMPVLQQMEYTATGIKVATVPLAVAE